MAGKLFVVATPLGNLADISQRALETLRSVDLIACEDTRRTARLLAHYEIHTPLLSCHRFNERERIEPLLEQLREGKCVACVADSGTPGVSDPGVLLVREALAEGLDVCPVPGPSAVTTLLSVSGLVADRFVFDGFLPHREGERRRRLRELRGERRTLVVFESPHRLRATLGDIEQVLGDRQLVLGRELSKLHETILRGRAAEIVSQLADDVRGEVTLVIAGAPADLAQEIEAGAERIVACWREQLARAGGERRRALRSAARTLGMKKAELQRRLMELGETD